jgi:hypothetical protein
LLVVPATLAPYFIFCIHPSFKEVGFLLKRIVTPGSNTNICLYCAVALSVPHISLLLAKEDTLMIIFGMPGCHVIPEEEKSACLADGYYLQHE